MKRVLLTVAVAAMLVLAGCNGGGGDGGTPTATDAPGTDAPGTEAPGDGTSGGDVSIPDGMDLPGVSESEGVHNLSMLLQGHLEAVSGNVEESFEMSSSSGTDTYDFANGTDGESLTYTNDTRGITEQWYRSGSLVGVQNDSATPAVTIARGQTPPQTRYGFTKIYRLVLFLAANSTQTSLESATTYEGQDALRLSVDGINNDPSTPSNFEGVSGHMLFTADGVLREFDVEATNATTGETMTLSYSASAVGSASPTEPEWTARAPGGTVALQNQDRVVALTYEGTQPIPAGTPIAVGSQYREYAETTLSSPLPPGETVYAVVNGSFGGQSVTAQVGSPPAVPNDAQPFTQSSPAVTITTSIAELQFGVQGN